jgi:hypothetical protein
MQHSITHIHEHIFALKNALKLDKKKINLNFEIPPYISKTIIVT